MRVGEIILYFRCLVFSIRRFLVHAHVVSLGPLWMFVATPGQRYREIPTESCASFILRGIIVTYETLARFRGHEYSRNRDKDVAIKTGLASVTAVRSQL